MSELRGRVLCVVHYPIFGGPHNKTMRLREPLRRRGWETTIAIPDEPGTAAPRLTAAGLEPQLLPLGRLRASPDPRHLLRYIAGFRTSVRALAGAIDRTGASVVQISGLVNPHAGFAARRRGAAVVWQIVDSRAPGLLRRVSMLFVRRFADAVMFNGEAIRELHGGGDLSIPTFVYYPPVDTERFVPSAERRGLVREELGIPPDAPVVGTVANLTPLKGIETFLGAAERIASTRPETRFVVVGSAPLSHAAYGARLQADAAALGLPHPVVFAGHRDDVEACHAAFDVHLITSRSEGTTTTALEAQAAGIPVVAGRVGAVHEVVEDGVTGFVVAPDRADLVADATLRLLADDALRERMGAAGRAAALARFDVEGCADVHTEAYEAALAHWRAARLATLPPADR
ncbi:MAG TPA: glycosyltransferase [Gaiellaceae bacterium]|nr:glycosyltransferase [Gaiellaceae bacterium]